MNTTTVAKESKKNFLENRIVIARPIPERSNKHLEAINPNHDGKYMYTGCGKIFVLPLSKEFNGLVRILNKEEQEFFEEKLDKPKGYLSFYNKDSAFWGKEINIRLDKDDKRLDLSDPTQNLQYRILMAWKDDIAPSWEERLNKGTYKWALVDEKYQSKVDSKVHEVKAQAYSELEKIKTNKAKMRDVLRLIGITTPLDFDESQLVASLGEIIDNTDKNSATKNIYDFLEVLGDKNKDTKLLIQDAVKIGEVAVHGKTKYYLKGGDLIGRTLNETVEWFNDPMNQEQRKIIEIRIKNS